MKYAALLHDGDQSTDINTLCDWIAETMSECHVDAREAYRIIDWNRSADAD